VVILCGDSAPGSSPGEARPGYSCSNPLAGSPLHFLVSPPLHIRLQKTFRHPLYPVIWMRTVPAPTGEIIIEHTVRYWIMPAFAHVPNLNAPTRPILLLITNRSSRKPHRIPYSFWRQPPTALRIAKIAELPQFLLRRNLTLMSGRSALSTPSGSQRKPASVQPFPAL